MVKKIISWVVESEEALAYFDPGDPNDPTLFKFVCANADPLEKSIGDYPNTCGRTIADWLTNHLNAKYPGCRWAILDYHAPRFGSAHHFILQQVLSDEDIALSGDILNAEGRLIDVSVSSVKRLAHRNSERSTTRTFLGI